MKTTANHSPVIFNPPSDNIGDYVQQADRAEPRKPKGKMVAVNCLCCKGAFMAKEADRKRGWGLYCSKSCKAKKQEARTGQHARFQARRERAVNRDEGDGSFVMSQEDLSYGGYNNAGPEDGFGEGKW